MGRRARGRGRPRSGRPGAERREVISSLQETAGHLEICVLGGLVGLGFKGPKPGRTETIRKL